MPSPSLFCSARVVSTARRLVLIVSVALLAPAGVGRAASVELARATIADLQAAFAQGTLTAEQLTALYLARIAAYDQRGPAINSVITLNPRALDEARALDAERREKGPRGPLHGIPVVVKDNYDTADLPTTAGSRLLKGSLPPDDAFLVRRLRAAGAILVAKVNLSEFASTAGGPNGFSSMGGQTLNPYDLTRGPAGSSGGTGAAIAAAFAQLGLGTDTGGSIRGPSAANGIVGLKPTHGLLSRDGIVPLALSFDTGGPMARSVHDVAVALNVLAAEDPADAATSKARGHIERDYTTFLRRGALKGARIGIARDFFKQSPETDRVMETAIARLQELGAVVIDPVRYPESMLRAKAGIYQAVNLSEFKVQITAYLGTLKPGYPHTLADLIAAAEAPESGYNNPWRLELMKRAQAAPGLDSARYRAAHEEGLAFVTATVDAVFAAHRLDALVYPTSPRPARPLAPEGTAGSAGTESATNIANLTGYPDLAVPAGLTGDGLPVTLSFFGPAFSEGRLLGYGFDFEQATHARTLPRTTPALPADVIHR